jgi:hypothetical protein
MTRKFTVAILALLLSSSACTAIAPEPTPTMRPTATARPTKTLIPTPTLTPTPLPPPGQSVTGVCIEVNVTGETAGQQILQDYLRTILQQSMGLTSGCESLLMVNVELGASSAEYKVEGKSEKKTCYTGTSAKGDMIFQVEGEEPHTFEIYKVIQPFSGTIYACPSKPKDANFPHAWGEDIINGLYAFFGPDVLPHVLTTWVRNDIGYVEDLAADKYIAVGDKAFYTLGTLLELLTLRYGDDKPMPDYDPSVSDYVRVLKAISGEDFGFDLGAWNDWWQSTNQ